MIPVALAFLVAAPVVWIIASSAMLCLVTHRWPLFVFPYDQWIQAVTWFRAVNLVMRLTIIGAGIPPTIVAVLIVLTVFNFVRRHRKRPALYGNTGWADTAEMRRGGIRRGG
jgi:hypothetical protein